MQSWEVVLAAVFCQSVRRKNSRDVETQCEDVRPASLLPANPLSDTLVARTLQEDTQRAQLEARIQALLLELESVRSSGADKAVELLSTRADREALEAVLGVRALFLSSGERTLTSVGLLFAEVAWTRVLILSTSRPRLATRVAGDGPDTAPAGQALPGASASRWAERRYQRIAQHEMAAASLKGDKTGRHGTQHQTTFARTARTPALFEDRPSVLLHTNAQRSSKCCSLLTGCVPPWRRLQPPPRQPPRRCPVRTRGRAWSEREGAAGAQQAFWCLAAHLRLWLVSLLERVVITPQRRRIACGAAGERWMPNQAEPSSCEAGERARGAHRAAGRRCPAHRHHRHPHPRPHPQPPLHPRHPRRSLGKHGGDEGDAHVA